MSDNELYMKAGKGIYIPIGIDVDHLQHILREAKRNIAELSKEARRLDWILSANAVQLNALDQWDRDNIDGAMDGEGAK